MTRLRLVSMTVKKWPCKIHTLQWGLLGRGDLSIPITGHLIAVLCTLSTALSVLNIYSHRPAKENHSGYRTDCLCSVHFWGSCLWHFWNVMYTGEARDPQLHTQQHSHPRFDRLKLQTSQWLQKGHKMTYRIEVQVGITARYTAWYNGDYQKTKE